jgi:hypothetical protein
LKPCSLMQFYLEGLDGLSGSSGRWPLQPHKVIAKGTKVQPDVDETFISSISMNKSNNDFKGSPALISVSDNDRLRTCERSTMAYHFHQNQSVSRQIVVATVECSRALETLTWTDCLVVVV